MSTAARIDELLSKFDENPRRYFAPLANEYRKAGELTQAIALCREHLPNQPGHMSGHIVFGQALFEYGDLAEAHTVFEAALALDPENLIALRHLGDIARDRGDALSARRWYGRVLEADPRNDDIAALLASLPSRATPIATPAVAAVPTTEQVPEEAPSFVDEPAWHTPAILGGEHLELPSVEIDGEAEAELLDLDSPMEPAVEVPTLFGAASTESTPVDAAFGAEPAADVTLDALLELDASALPPSDAVTFEALQIESLAADAEDAELAMDAEREHAAPRDSLSDAIGAFATHDPLDTASALERGAGMFVSHAEAVEADAGRAEESASSASVTEYGDGLDDIEWPDASQLSVRMPSPARSLTPVETWSPVAAVPESEDIESLVEAPAEADADAFEVESLVESPAEAEAEAFEVESLVESPAEAEAEAFEVESLVESPVEAEAAAFEVESLVESPVEAEAEAFEVESLVESPGQALEVSEAAREDAEPAAPMDEDPPFSAGEMPWLMTTEEEREAEEADLLEASALPDSPAFVTETMAELLVAQGFVARAVGVYEELVVLRPDDVALSSRLAALRASLEAEVVALEPVAVEQPEPTFTDSPSAPLGVVTPARSNTPRAVPFIAPSPRRTAREWLSRLAAMQVARRTPATDQVVVSMPTPADGLASLFGASPLPADDVAARSLATAYGGAVPLDSSAPLFPGDDAVTLSSEAPRVPVSASSSEPTGGASVYSFDRFFPDPATTAHGPSASSDAPTATSPTGAPSDDPTSPGADLAQFSHWLKGLSNS